MPKVLNAEYTSTIPASEQVYSPLAKMRTAVAASPTPGSRSLRSYGQVRLKKIKIALLDEKFRGVCQKTKNPYGVGDSAKKTVKVLVEIDLNAKLLNKKMTI